MRGAWVLGLMTLYLAVGFGVRSAILYRRTGAFGFHGVRDGAGFLEWCAGALLVLSLAGGFAAPVLDLLGILRPVSGLTTPAIQAFAFAVFFLGFLATFGAQMAMGDSWRVGVPRDQVTALVTGGPFAVVRNPIFTAMLLASSGLMLLVPNAAALGSWTGVFIGLELHVRFVEEPHLLRVHGEAYLRYASRVGRFLPLMGQSPSFKSGT